MTATAAATRASLSENSRTCRVAAAQKLNSHALSLEIPENKNGSTLLGAAAMVRMPSFYECLTHTKSSNLFPSILYRDTPSI
uniref:Uncharacterized protein n=1 Tax=Cannabis sativa TaxID=3483 RepID=A0A803RBA5_CANSA